jgi:hypothetical protein
MKEVPAHGNSDARQRPRLEALEPRLVPVTSALNWVSSLYELGLDRQPDSRGLENHAARIESGVAPASVAGSIFNSGEHDRSLSYQPKILKEYQDKDLVYTQILNRFDD